MFVLRIIYLFFIYF